MREQQPTTNGQKLDNFIYNLNKINRQQEPILRKKLYPENQHGFWAKKSNPWAQIQQEWALTAEHKQITGVLLRDLSAAFDSLGCEILRRKLEIQFLDALSPF